MINLDNFAAVGEYVLVRKDQDTSDINTIVLTTGDHDQVLKGEVLSAEVSMDSVYDDDDGEFYTAESLELDNWRRGDKLLFNKMKALKIMQPKVDEEVYIVRREDIFGGFTVQEEE